MKTFNEIHIQPELWVKVYSQILENRVDISVFLKKLLINQDLQIILTGAGTSAFIGEVLEGPFQWRTGISTRAIATSELVTHPELYVNRNSPILLISFARSGDSPESSQAVEVVEKISHKASHLIITCNPESVLIDTIKGKNHHTILMPPEANDESLAMTASFTSMLLTGLLLTRIESLAQVEKQIISLCKYGKKILSNYGEDIKKAAEQKFLRAVFLGSGLLKGIAHEAHLKLQELTDGKVICKYDSFLGFRHGPKAVLDNETLIMYFFSNDIYVNNYERDLVLSINDSGIVKYSIGVSECKIPNLKFDLEIFLTESSDGIDEDLYSLVSILPAQLLGYYKSLNLGLIPDSPSERGIISRVVQGVKLYPFNK